MEIFKKEIVYTKNFINKDLSKSLFLGLIKELLWGSFDWNDNIDSPSYIYGTFERKITKKELLEDLITLIEKTFETDVIQTRCRLYKNGEDFMHTRHMDNYNFVHLLLGSSRKLQCKNRESDNIFSVKNCGMLYIPSNKNGPGAVFSVKKNKKIFHPTIHIYFCINDAYKSRHYGKCVVHLLGVGDLTIDYDKRTHPEGLCDKTIISVSQTENIAGSLLDNNRGVYLPDDRERLFGLFEG